MRRYEAEFANTAKGKVKRPLHAPKSLATTLRQEQEQVRRFNALPEQKCQSPGLRSGLPDW